MLHLGLRSEVEQLDWCLCKLGKVKKKHIIARGDANKQPRSLLVKHPKYRIKWRRSFFFLFQTHICSRRYRRCWRRRDLSNQKRKESRKQYIPSRNIKSVFLQVNQSILIDCKVCITNVRLNLESRTDTYSSRKTPSDGNCVWNVRVYLGGNDFGSRCFLVKQFINSSCVIYRNNKDRC